MTRGIRRILLILMICIMNLAVVPALASAPESGTETSPLVNAGDAITETDGDRELTITVVENTEAVDIQDNAVPLAAYSDQPDRSGIRHLILMSLVLIMVILYVSCRVRSEKRLIVLRREAARAEHERMRARASHSQASGNR